MNNGVKYVMKSVINGNNQKISIWRMKNSKMSRAVANSGASIAYVGTRLLYHERNMQRKQKRRKA
jgi:ActR/RegA family two-component response regulator